MICALREFTFNLPLDGRSTCPLENFFAFFRLFVHDCNQFSEILPATPRNTIVNQIFHGRDHPQDVRHRVKRGGIVSKPEAQDEMQAPASVQDASDRIVLMIRSFGTPALNLIE
jgi:hypothetical protein